MFIYWDGYEIDGSDTDFNIILPESIQVYEFVECFLSIPIFNDVTVRKPFVYYRRNNKQFKLSLKELKDKLLSGCYPEICIDINCQHPEQLPDELRAEIYAISERREPHEAAYGKVENPCTPPVAQQYYTRGEMTVELRIQKPGANEEYQIDESENNGYVYNIEMINLPGSKPNEFLINMGPSFYYEYAMYIVDYIRDRFPSLGIYGGLDCGGGWTDGCTYSASIYRYERVCVPVKYSVKNTIKRLTEYKTARSYKAYYKRGWKYEYEFVNGFILASQRKMEPEEKLKKITLSEYISLVETSLLMQTDLFTQICDTAVRIKLPFPNEYNENSGAAERLRQALPQLDESVADWYFTGYLAFASVDEKPVCEFRVHYTMKKYLLELLELSESGAIDFIKTETYNERHD
jgi:hypothetical protein